MRDLLKNNNILWATVLSVALWLGYTAYNKIANVKNDTHATISHKKTPSLKNYAVYYAHENLPQKRIESTVDCLKDSHYLISRNGVIQDPNIIAEYFPLLVKESFLRQKNDNGKMLTSRTGAMGIAQIKEPAVVDAKKFLQDKLGVDIRDYNPEEMEDNCTLGMAYFIRNKAILKGKLPEKMTFDDEFYYAAYNGGATRIAEMMIMFQKEKGVKHITWKEFAEWLSAKAIGIEWNKSDIGFSKSYNVEYNNFFQTSLIGNKDILTFGSKIETTKEKIQEIVNYVEIIDGIRFTDQSARQGEIVIKGRSLLYEESRDEFHGDGFIDKMRYNIWKSIGQHNSYRQIMSIPGKGAFSMLASANVYPSQENLRTFYKLNYLEEDDVIKKGKYYLVPNIETEVDFTEWEDGRDIRIEIPEFEKGSWWKKESKSSISSNVNVSIPNVQKFLDSIEVKNNSLKWKIFILDPGHGGIDTGAIFQALNKDGKSIPYFNNDIKYLGKAGQYSVRRNGEGDDILYAVEATLVMDVSLRLAVLIRQNGGVVKFTHASIDKINNKDIIGSKNKNNPGQLDSLENDYVKWVPGKKFDTSGQSRERARNRQAIRDELLPDNQRNTYLLSLHIDSLDHKKDTPIEYFYNTSSQNIFAEKMMENSGKIFGKDVIISNKRKLYILWDKPEDENQVRPQNAALIELGNIQNQDFNYRIRTAAGRQTYAENIFNALKKTATS